jgi:TatD DNase family protein
MNRLVDVHAHLHHRAFEADREAAVARAEAAGLEAIIENGLDPASNRRVLELAERHTVVRPALGIYPLNAVAKRLQHWDAPHRPEPFDVAAELAFIEAQSGRIAAIGECGLDGHWAPETVEAQREVFVELIRLALRLDLPLVVHSRERERECIELLEKEGARRVDLHCFGGKLADAARAAENGWYLSVPPVLLRSSSFQAIARKLGPDRILTETDCPYQGPRKDERNEPAYVVETVRKLAQIWGGTEEQAAARVWSNFAELFGRGREA